MCYNGTYLNHLLDINSYNNPIVVTCPTDITSIGFWASISAPVTFDITFLNDINTEISDINTEISDINTEISDINTDIIGYSKTSKEFPIVGYIDWSTGIIQSSGYHSTNLIKVTYNSIIKIKNFNGSYSVACIAAYDKNLNYLQNKSKQGSDGSKFIYVVPSDVSYIRMCTYDSYIGTAEYNLNIISDFIKREKVTDDINNQDNNKIPNLGIIKDVKKELSVGFSYGNEILTKSGYLVYINNGGLITHDDFDCEEAYYKVIPGQRWRCHFNATGTAGICFYNSNKEYLNLYWQSNGGAAAEFIVPENAAYARFCNRRTVVANPYFKLLQNYDDLQTLTDKVNNIDNNVPKCLPSISRLYPQTKLPVCSFQFDDVSYKDSQLVTLFESYKLTCAFAFIASTSNITNKAELYKKYQEKGFQIMNHSVDGNIFNLTNYTYQTALETINTALNRIQDAGMVCNGFVSPSSTMEPTFMPILKMFHAYAFTSATSIATANGRNQDTCDLHRYSLQSHTLAEIKQFIDDCITNDQIITFYGHAADLIDGGDTSVFSLAFIAAVIEYCISKRNAGVLYLGGTDDCVKYFFDL